jgi:hypothetical protein
VPTAPTSQETAPLIEPSVPSTTLASRRKPVRLTDKPPASFSTHRYSNF